MKLIGIFAAAALVGAPTALAAQGRGVVAAGGAQAAIARLAPPRPAALVRGGARQVGFAGARLDRPNDRGRFRRRGFVVGLYPFWGWDCTASGPCGWDDDEGPGLTPADYDDPPPEFGQAAADWSRPPADSNECSDWVWRPKLRRSVCVKPFRG